LIVLPFTVADIQGWTLPNELRFLYEESVRLEAIGIPGDLLEVGCWLGRSTYPLACAGRVDVIDTFKGSWEILPSDRVRDQAKVFATNMTRLGVGSRVRAYQGESWYWLERLPGPYRLIFVDGAHDYPTCANDLRQAQRLLSPGGALAVDDVHPTFPGVQRAVKEVLHNDLEREIGKIGVWRCPRERVIGSAPRKTDRLATSRTPNGLGG
jgi:predicted O-methyltransferase YrrM